jgi:hypothetical protein
MRSLTLFLPVLPLLIVNGCAESHNGGTSATAPGVNAIKPVAVADPAVPGYFVDVTAQTGIKHKFENGDEAGHFAILESLGGGVALIDYDQDGLLDIFLPGGGYYTPEKVIKGHPCKLYKNLGNWKFRDATAEAGLDKIEFYSHGGTVGDYDNDGWPDLLVTGFGRMALFRNNKGKFEDVTAQAGLQSKDEWHWSTSAAFADFNGDQLPDLFVAHYVNWHLLKNHPTCNDSFGVKRDVCSPKRFEGLQHYLYLNDGKGGFLDVTQSCVIDRGPDGKETLQPLKKGKGLGVIVLDVNHDGKPDIYVANDTTDNYLYINRGNARFEELATQLGVARDENNTPNGSMGLAAADYDGSGHYSIFVTNYQHESHQLYRNQGNGPFYFASARAGITAIGMTYVGWGTSFFDFDRDGAEDLFILNGHVVRFPPPPGSLKQRPVLLKNMRQPGEKPFNVHFKDVTEKGGPFFFDFHMGRGCAVGDLDNDGRPDIVVNRMKENVVILRNDVKNDNHWLGVQLVGKPYRDAAGAELILELEVDHQGKKLTQQLHRQVLAGGSWASTSDRRTLFGLNAEHRPVIRSLLVKWPDGKTQTFAADVLKPDRYLRIEEGEAAPKELLPSSN